jgi:probable rRNA maturation factor
VLSEVAESEVVETVQVDVQLALEAAGGIATQWSVPDADMIQAWAVAAVKQVGANQSGQQITVRIVDVDEITQLNEQFRHKAGATNVLSFPFELPPGVPEEACDATLGDLVICAAVVEQEAKAQHKSAEAHWAHMIVHGTLHLLGYDHLTDDEAQQMEAEEIAVLNGLGYANPYE